MKTGAAFLLAVDGTKQPIRLKLTEDFLYLQTRESTSKLLRPADNIDPSLVNKERKVTIKRQKSGGFGLSVKGGAEHGLPILISRMFKDQAAEKTGQLNVGDALIEVNGVNVELMRHEDAVTVLKSAGEEVSLTVRFFQPAFYFLTTSKDNIKSDEISNGMPVISDREKYNYTLEKRWNSISTIPLLCAFASSVAVKNGKSDSIYVESSDKSASATLSFSDSRNCADWLVYIHRSISLQNQLHVNQINKSLPICEQIFHMCWMLEVLEESKHYRPLFLLLRATDVSVHEAPVLTSLENTNVKCETKFKIYECLFRRTKSIAGDVADFNIDLIDGGGSVTTRRFTLEVAEEMVRLETNWYKCTYFEIKRLQLQNFNCLFRNTPSILTLSFDAGFQLDCQGDEYKFRFSQLKNSYDDGNKCLTLSFFDAPSSKTISWTLECCEVQKILFSINAFLSAKLSSLDPVYLLNQTYIS